jgi:hypothetical protein
MKMLVVALVVALVVLVAVAPAAAQPADAADVWRTFAEQVEVGAAITVRLTDGRTFTGTLVAAHSDALLVQPRTRIAVPVQAVPYEDIVSIARERKGGIGAGKAVLIGVASGAAAFLGILLLVIASVQD